jgi:lysophospholipase L1-like esterase
VHLRDRVTRVTVPAGSADAPARRRLRTAALILVEAALVLGVLEIAIRAAVAPQIDVPHMRVYPEGYYTWYPRSRFTYHNLPQVEPPSATVRINAHGLRGPEIASPKPAGERRVLVLGDSYTASVQLPENRIYTTLLEEELRDARGNGGYRVINAGVNGAGTAHELLYFLYQGAALAPDVVVLQYAFNDLDDTRLHGGFRLTANGVELREDLRRPAFWRAPLLAVRDALGNRSLAFYLFYRAVTGAHPQPATAAALPTIGPAAAEASAPELTAAAEGLDPAEVLVTRLVARLIATTNASGARVIVLTIPSPLYVTGGDAAYDRLVAAFRTLVANGPNQLIVADPLLAAANSRGEEPYLAHDGHLGETGHRLVAHALTAAVLNGETARHTQ